MPLLRRGREGRTRLTPSAARDPWRRWEISAVQTAESAPKPRIAAPLAERLKRAITDTQNPDPELLGALAELAFGDVADGPVAHREIRFLTLSDRARAEAITQQRQPELVERLIKDSITRTAFREQEARVLFELMIPTDSEGRPRPARQRGVRRRCRNRGLPLGAHGHRRRAALRRQRTGTPAPDHPLPPAPRRSGGTDGLRRRRSDRDPSIPAARRRPRRKPRRWRRCSAASSKSPTRRSR